MRDAERLDKPSASSFEIVVACPGQPNLLRSLPAQKAEEPDEVQLSGTQIHKARETGNTLELDEDQVEVYRAGLKYERELVSLWKESLEIGSYEEKQRESRMWLHDPSTGEPCLSAKLDVHYMSDGATHFAGGESLCVVDWKSGWSWKLTPSQRNWQLRVQAVLAAREYNNVKHVRVAFIKPIAKYERIDFTDYTEDDLKRSEEAIYQHLWLAKQPDAPRHAGLHCNYCPCKAWCREAAAYAMLPSIINTSSNQVMTMQPELSKENIIALIETLPLQQVAFVHTRAGLVSKVLEAVKVRLKACTDEQLYAVGLFRSEGKRLDPIVDVKGAFEFLRDKYNISEAELWKALKFSKEELVDALRRDQGWGKDQASGLVKGQLKPFIQEKRAEGSVGSV